jgi:predicted Na+-dependent transporter
MGASLLKGLAWLGGLGSRGIAAAVLTGLALPWLAPVFKPWLAPAIVVMLTIAFLRVKPEALMALRASPWRIVLVTAWMMVATPFVVGLACRLVGPLEPGLLLGIALQVAAPPTMTSAAYAVMLGLDAAYGLALLLAAMALTPVTAPSAAAFVTGTVVPIDTVALGIRLAIIIVGAVGAAAVIRRLAGAARVERHARSLDGCTMILLFVFAIAVMDGVSNLILTRPLELLRLVALVFALSLAMTWSTVAVFRAFGFDAALTAGLAAGHRNMGVLIAAWSTTLPDPTWAWFGAAQFPVYLAPITLGWIAAWRRRRLSETSHR